MLGAKTQKQVNLRVGSALYSALETIAHHERRSVPQAARLLLEEGLRHRIASGNATSDILVSDIAKLATAGGAFDWLFDDRDVYDDSSGEPV